MLSNLRVHFVEYDTPLFHIYRAWDAPTTANYALQPAPADAVADPEYEGFVFCDTAILFTAGRWRYANADLPTGAQVFGEGDGGFRHRLPTGYVITALDARNGKVCVAPKDGAFWQRQVVGVPNQESQTLGPWPQDRYLFVGRGRLVLGNGEGVVNTVPLRLRAGESVEVTCTAAALALLMWKEKT